MHSVWLHSHNVTEQAKLMGGEGKGRTVVSEVVGYVDSLGRGLEGYLE